MKKSLLLFSLVLLFFAPVAAQPKHEFRAVWVATVNNIDWPSKSGLSTAEQKREAISILDRNKALGMNAIIFQVRPAADAFYASELEPWSRYLTGKQGQAPQPFYDPLKFWIDECHARGMEFHAWLNPYRITQRANEELSVNHIVFRHPEWVLVYGNKLYFDPGIPEVRDFITYVVGDLVARYDLDAIHMDDYFYPYPTSDEFPDSLSFEYYGRDYLPEEKAEWRRENVDVTIKMLNERIKSVKPLVKFGISPFGVWRNIADDTSGSETSAGVTNYDHLYANVLKWQEEGWIDYLLPQLYWYIGQPAADFEVLAKWWSKHAYGRSVYIGHAPYKVDSASQTEQWHDPKQLPRQIELLRSIPEISGSAYFSSRSFSAGLLGFQDSLQMKYYRKPAIIPATPWLDARAPAPVSKLKRSGRTVKWKTVKTAAETDKARNYVVYLNEKGRAFDPTAASDIFDIVTQNELKFERINHRKKKYEVRISVVNRMNNESKISKPLVVKL